ncbi:MAG: alpha/beta hydrolase [Nitrospirales bacterium]|nr:MAG: alpha/beta hydrolase [Nitrospirales bacterium]
MTQASQFEIQGADSKLIIGDRITGKDRQILFITGFLSKRWGNKSRALAHTCQEHHWGFCCFDFRGNGDSEGAFGDYTLHDWLDDARRVVTMIADGPPLTIIGSSLGGWLAWVLGQQLPYVRQLLLLAPAFNMMGKRAQDISPTRRDAWEQTGWMPWDDDALHRDFPLSWKWVKESEALWAERMTPPRRVPTTILHGLQDTVISPTGSWDMTEHLLTQDLHYPIELILKTGDHRFSSARNLETFLALSTQSTIHA